LQQLKGRAAALVQHHDLVVEDRRLRPQFHRGGDDLGEFGRVVRPAPRDDARAARLPAAADEHAHAEAVELELVHPALARGRLGDEQRLLRIVGAGVHGVGWR